jgi:hypothetical protein
LDVLKRKVISLLKFWCIEGLETQEREERGREGMK